MSPSSCPLTSEHLGEVQGAVQGRGQVPVGDRTGDLRRDILAHQGHPHLAADGVIAFVSGHQALRRGWVLIPVLHPGDADVRGAEAAGGAVERHRVPGGRPLRRAGQRDERLPSCGESTCLHAEG